MPTCTHQECEFEAFGANSECSLHCPKSSYETDFNSGLISDFYSNLLSLTVKLAARSRTYNNDIEEIISNENRIRTNITDGRHSLSRGGDTERFFREPILYVGINFPDRRSTDQVDFFRIFHILEATHFKSCNFKQTSLTNNSKKYLYEDCVFERGLTIDETLKIEALESISNTIFIRTQFLKLDISNFDENTTIINPDLLFDCTITDSIEITNSLIKGVLIKPHTFHTVNKKTSCELFAIHNVVFESALHLSGIETDNFVLESSQFQERVNIEACAFNDIKIYKTTFNKQFILSHSAINQAHMSDSTFTGYFEIKGTKFAVKSTPTEIENNRFLDFCSLMSNHFKSGLHLRHNHFSHMPNMSNSVYFYSETNRETYRIAKHSNDSNGNFLDANLYFSLEMKKYKEELYATKGSWSEKIVYGVHEHTSNFGQSYIRPIVLLGTITFLYTLFFTDTVDTPCTLLISICSDFKGQINIPEFPTLNAIVDNIIPLGIVSKNDTSISRLLLYISQIILIWQIVVAIKRRTKR